MESPYVVSYNEELLMPRLDWPWRKHKGFLAERQQKLPPCSAVGPATLCGGDKTIKRPQGETHLACGR
jgi:hypothetical protein